MWVKGSGPKSLSDEGHSRSEQTVAAVLQKVIREAELSIRSNKASLLGKREEDFLAVRGLTGLTLGFNALPLLAMGADASTPLVGAWGFLARLLLEGDFEVRGFEDFFNCDELFWENYFEKSNNMKTHDIFLTVLLLKTGFLEETLMSLKET